MKKIEIIPISRKKLKRRQISEEWVRKTVNSPDQIIDGYGGRKIERYWKDKKDEN
jgi:hypothetical protein